MPNGRKPPCGPEVGEARLRAEVAKVKDDHRHPGEDERDDGHDLDQGEPELELAEHAHGKQVGAVQSDQRGERRHPLRHPGQPEAHIDADCGDLRHRRRTHMNQ